MEKATPIYVIACQVLVVGIKTSDNSQYDRFNNNLNKTEQRNQDAINRIQTRATILDTCWGSTDRVEIVLLHKWPAIRQNYKAYGHKVDGQEKSKH